MKKNIYAMYLSLIVVSMWKTKKKYVRGVKIDWTQFMSFLEKYRSDKLLSVSNAISELWITQAIYQKIKNWKKIDISTVEKIKIHCKDVRVVA